MDIEVSSAQTEACDC